MDNLMSWKDHKVPTEHEGERCRVAYYKYGATSIDVVGYDYGIIRSGVWGKRTDALIGYAVSYDFDQRFNNDPDKEHFASARDVEILD